MRTRRSPTVNVRQSASPVVPGCTVGVMFDQSVTVNGRAGIFIGRPYNREPPGFTGRDEFASGMKEKVAGATGLEPATFGVTGRRSNQLNYAPAWAMTLRRERRSSKEAGF